MLTYSVAVCSTGGVGGSADCWTLHELILSGKWRHIHWPSFGKGENKGSVLLWYSCFDRSILMFLMREGLHCPISILKRCLMRLWNDINLLFSPLPKLGQLSGCDVSWPRELVSVSVRCWRIPRFGGSTRVLRLGDVCEALICKKALSVKIIGSLTDNCYQFYHNSITFITLDFILRI